MKLERDRLASRVSALETQLQQLEGARSPEDPMKADVEPTAGPKKPRGAMLPPDARDNPALGRDLPAPNTSRWGLAKTFEAHSASVSALSVHPTKPIVATASDDGVWKMWSISGGAHEQPHPSVVSWRLAPYKDISLFPMACSHRAQAISSCLATDTRAGSQESSSLLQAGSLLRARKMARSKFGTSRSRGVCSLSSNTRKQYGA